MRIVFAGSPAVALPGLTCLLDGRHDVVAVLSRPDAPAGRGRSPRPSPVAALARDRGIETLTPATSRDPATTARLRELAPDLGVVVAYGGLLGDATLATAEHGWVNLHFSLLPRWRGAAPVQHTIIHGDTVAGATVFRLVAELDAGPVYAALPHPLRGAESAGDLLAELSVGGAGLLAATVDAIAAGTAVARPQPAAGITLAPKITVAAAAVDWTAPSVVVDRLVRGCTPAPGAWTAMRGERVKLGPVRVVREPVGPLAPGRLRAGRREVLAGTGDGAVQLGTVQAAGRRAVPAADWARGVRLDDAESFA